MSVSDSQDIEQATAMIAYVLCHSALVAPFILPQHRTARRQDAPLRSPTKVCACETRFSNTNVYVNLEYGLLPVKLRSKRLVSS